MTSCFRFVYYGEQVNKRITLVLKLNLKKKFKIKKIVKKKISIRHFDKISRYRYDSIFYKYRDIQFDMNIDNSTISKTSLVIPSQHLSTKPSPQHGATNTKMVQQLCTSPNQPPCHGATTSTTINSLNNIRYFSNKIMLLPLTPWAYRCHHHT